MGVPVPAGRELGGRKTLLSVRPFFFGMRVCGKSRGCPLLLLRSKNRLVVLAIACLTGATTAFASGSG